MIKDIAYSGLSATPSDYNSPDGALAAAFNLIPENGALSPVAPPTLLYRVPKPYRPLLIHKIPGGPTHYIFVGLDDDKIHTNISYATADELASGDWSGLPHWICQVSGNVITHAILGNVIAIASDNAPMSYLIWRENSYVTLPQKPPFIPISFSLDHQEIRLQFTADLSSYSGNNINTTDNRRHATDAYIGILNRTVREQREKGKFTQPFFVRYAYRLFDGSYIMPSEPVLLNPMEATSHASQAAEGYAEVFGIYESYDAVPFQAYIISSQLHYGIINDQKWGNEIKKWDELIAAIDIFVSAPIPMYNTDTDVTLDRSNAGEYSGARAILQPIGNYNEKVMSVATFYKFASISIDQLKGMPLVQFKAIPLMPEETDLNNIVTRPTLTDIDETRYEVMPSYLHTYNSRLIYVPDQQTLIPLRPFTSMTDFKSLSQNAETIGQCTLEVYGKKNGKWYRNASAEVIPQLDAFPYWLFVNDPNARILSITFPGHKTDTSGDTEIIQPNPGGEASSVTTSVQTVVLKLKQHDFLNGSFWIIGDIRSQFIDGQYSIPSSDTSALSQLNEIKAEAIANGNKTLAEKSAIHISSVNNPFHFPAVSVTTVSSGAVMAISSAAKALSQGQFGQFPLYAFTSEGVWALELTSTGTFAARQPITRDVCVCPEGITQIDSAVLFPTSRGIMLLEGSKATPISDPLFAASFSPQSLPSISALLSGSGIDISQINPMQFPQFITHCRMAYDYPRQRIIVYRPDSSMAYLFSLKSKAWGAMQSSLSYTLNSYPDALAVDTDGNILNLSDTSDAAGAEVPTLLLSRPLKLDNPDILKTVDTVLQRGYFRKDHIRSMLYGSRDLFSWHCIASSVDHNLRGFRGSPYKYFRILLTASLSPDESISGATIRFTSRYTNRPR